MLALANCGKHYHRYPQPEIIAGDLPCPRGCASPAFQSQTDNSKKKKKGFTS